MFSKFHKIDILHRKEQLVITFKVSCCETVTRSALVAGVHFTAKMLYALGKRGNWVYNVKDGSSDLSL
jgi:hypothetical protein